MKAFVCRAGVDEYVQYVERNPGRALTCPADAGVERSHLELHRIRGTRNSQYLSLLKHARCWRQYRRRSLTT